MKRNLLVILVLTPLVVLSCAPKPTTPILPTPAETPARVISTPEPSAAPSIPLIESLKPTHTLAATPKPTSPSDTTPPSAITGLISNNTYDKRVNLWWDKSTATDFDHYNIYLNKADITDVTGVKAVQQVNDIATYRYQATEVDDGTKYYFAVTAVDKNGNESTKVTSVSATPTPMPRGTKESDMIVEVYAPELTWAGTTLFRDSHITGKNRIVEMNMLGEVVWEYLLPQSLGAAGDAELLPNNNILFTAKGGVYEIERNGKIVWQYLNSKIDHDADRLSNGNTIFVFGMNDQKGDAQVTEVNPKGEVVWQWHAKDFFDKPPYSTIFEEDSWTHANAVIRLSNGNTLVSLRNFDMVVEVNPKAEVVRIIGEGTLKGVHDPEVIPNGNILAALPATTNPIHAIEINQDSGAVAWQ